MDLPNATIRTAACLCLLSALGACTEGSEARLDERTADEAAVADPQPANTVDAAALPDFRPLVRQYGDAVVNVEVLQRRERGDVSPRAAPGDPLYEFFRRFGIPPPGTGPGGELPPARGAGSGFIVSEDGYILTNAHVVAGADEVTVRLTDRREFQAEVIGVDARTDVAVIRIDATDLPTVRLGDPERLEPGQWVLAIGSPFGLENSATAGIISATSRAVGAGSTFIQTDVAVNPGNSGGPLFNLQGEVVGINSMIFSQTGGYMGLSFAIPIDQAINVKDQLIEHGRVVRGRIGVIIQDMDAQLARSFGLDRPRGALVSGVEEDGPAAEAGLKSGDVILRLNGEPIDRFNDLGAAIASMQPGSEAALSIWRDREEQEVEVRVEEAEDQAAQVDVEAPDGSAEEQLGLVVRALTAEEKRFTGSEGNIVIEQVSGAAAAAGLQPGDIIIGVNSIQIESLEQLREAVEESAGSVALLIERDGATIFVPLPTDSSRNRQ
jgi:serine protease Do